jgi:drug/metabolite transporter (DMT)-like permease
MADTRRSPVSVAVALPALLVFLSSTSFIVARAIAPHANPVLFIFVRFLLVAAIFAMLAYNVEWPKGRQMSGHFLAGMVINGVYLVASFWAVANGLAASIMTLLVSLQPVLIAGVTVCFLKKTLGSKVWFGLSIGIAGVALVISPRLTNVGVAGVPALPIVVGLFGVIALTGGTMVQKSSLAKADLRAMGAVQHLGGAIVAGAAMFTIEGAHWDNDPSLWLGLIWAVAGLSLAGTSMFIWMVRRGDATRVTALMLLVPPATALQAWLLFGDSLSSIQIAGFVITLIGVAAVQGGGITKAESRQPQVFEGRSVS